MAITKQVLDRQAEGKTFAFGTTSASGQGLVSINNGTAATTNVVLDVKGSSNIAGDLNLTGNLNIIGNVNTQTVTNTNIADITLTLNDGGTTASAAGAGLFVEGDANTVIGKLLFDNTLTSKWKIGDGTTQREVVDVSSVQTLTNKIIGGGQISGNIAGNAANVTGTVGVSNGGTGAVTLTGYVKGTGTTAMTAAATIPGADISGNISGNAVNVTGIVAIANGGTGQATAAAGFNALSPITTLGDLIVGSAANTSSRLAGSTSATPMFLKQTGTGTVSALPVWSALAAGDIPILNQNTTGTASNVTGIVAFLNGGTGASTVQGAINATNPHTTLGDISFRDATNVVRLAGNITAAKQFLTQTGTGAASAAPVWAGIGTADVPTLNQNTTGTAANVTGIVAVANGGTGKSSISTGALLIGAGTSAPTELVGVTSGHVVTWNGTTFVVQAPSGSAAFGHWTTVTGTQDGTNKTFTIGATVSSGSEIIVVNGAVLDNGASNDYVLTGTSLVFQAGFTAPTPTDKIKAFGTY